ncbi:MAG: omptin family outer membrane protease [Arcobacteraceae bacterium]|nr:omptin family outer membrane protease [Arcobacteraceae bacterium]
MLKIILLSFFLFATSLFSKNLPIYGNVYLSQYSSQSSEIVYESNSGKKLSELIWKIDNVSLFGIGFQVPCQNKFKFNLNYQSMITENSGMMTDYDWLKDYTTDWSDRSIHPTTKITNISIFDINLQYDLKNNKYGNRYIVYAGYKVEEHGFEAWDGSYIYSSNNGFRDKNGIFNGLGITYKEEFKSFYLKGMAIKSVDDFVLKGFISYSPFVIVTNEDTHHFRSFTNTNSFNSTTMYEVGFMLNYYLSRDILIGLDYTKRVYNETDGTTSRYYYDTTIDKYNDGTVIPKGTRLVYGGAGIKSESTTNTFLKVTFKF